jgi:hypothetical protein
MNTYRIKNITDLIGKREYNYNSTLTIEYIDGITKKKIKIEPGEVVNLSINSLPISVHRLRVKKLVTVVETQDVEERQQKSVGSITHDISEIKKTEKKINNPEITKKRTIDKKSK